MNIHQVLLKPTITEKSTLLQESGRYTFQVALKANKAQVKVETRLSDDVPGVMADGSQIKQVLINVIINAVQAMESTGEKVLKVYVDTVMKNEGQFVVIGFHDSGEGMTDEELKQIFEPFYTTKTSGAGLGGTRVWACRLVTR